MIRRPNCISRSALRAAILAAVLASLAAAAVPEPASDFTFVQLSDIHWGFSNPAVNPDASRLLFKTIQAVNSMTPPPDFVVITGDLTHSTEDTAFRRRRMTGLRELLHENLKVRDVRFLPGEHDAALDTGRIYRSVFGPAYSSFEHKGIHFIELDNGSDPTSSLGPVQLQWLSADLKKLDSASARIVVFCHRPLFDLYPAWDWQTRDGAQARALLAPFKDVSVFYGHIHQRNRQVTGNLTNYAASGLMYPLPAPGSVEKKAPVAWDSLQPYRGLGFRRIDVKASSPELGVTEYAADQLVPVIAVTAKKFEYTPNRIVLKKGEQVFLELTSLDRLHGFNCPGLGIRADVKPGEISRLSITPDKTGTFEFHCDNFCGEGHSDMTGSIVVE